jgi:hypothetical protein
MVSKSGTWMLSTVISPGFVSFIIYGILKAFTIDDVSHILKEMRPTGALFTASAVCISCGEYKRKMCGKSVNYGVKGAKGVAL